MEKYECTPYDQQVVINSQIQIIDCSLMGTTNWGYIASQIEGALEIHINGSIFLSETNILLIELAQVIHNWLNNDVLTFYYQSMDYEEESIIKISQCETGKYFISSIWATCKCEIDLVNWTQECKDFLSDLDCQLIKHGLRLNKFLPLTS